MKSSKLHSDDLGYIAEKMYKPSGSCIVLYYAEDQGIDVGNCKYAVVCSLHATICGDTSVRRAKMLMDYPEFCEECMNAPIK